MFNEMSFMRYGKGPGGLMGLTPNEKLVKRGHMVYTFVWRSFMT